MTAIAEKIMTVEEYIQHELKSERRHEYINGQLFEMPEEKDTNNEISNFLTFFFFALLKKRGFSFYAHDMKVAIPGKDKYYYPDWFLTAEPKTDDNRYIKYQPELIVEVISKTSYVNDTVNKFIDYTKIPSLKYYLTINPETPAVTVFAKGESGEWEADTFSKPTDIILLPLLGLELPIKEIHKIVQEG